LGSSKPHSSAQGAWIKYIVMQWANWLGVRARDIATRSRVYGGGGVMSHNVHNGTLTKSGVTVKSSDQT